MKALFKILLLAAAAFAYYWWPKMTAANLAQAIAANDHTKFFGYLNLDAMKGEAFDEYRVKTKQQEEEWAKANPAAARWARSQAVKSEKQFRADAMDNGIATMLAHHRVSLEKLKQSLTYRKGRPEWKKEHWMGPFSYALVDENLGATYVLGLQWNGWKVQRAIISDPGGGVR